jgi:PAS domain S-box-containing protein
MLASLRTSHKVPESGIGGSLNQNQLFVPRRNSSVSLAGGGRVDRADRGVSMEAQPEQPAEEIERLQRCIDDLDGVTALPAVWGGEPAEIVRTLLELLLGTLSLDLVYVRSEVAVGGPPVEMARVAQSLSLPAGPKEIGKLFDRWLGDDPREWPPLARHTVGDGGVTVVPLRLGLRGEIGVLVAGSRRADFPQRTERLVLSVAANQAAVGLQQARLLSEQRRVEVELDERVAQRTRELAAANEALQKEAAERRRAEEALRESEDRMRTLAESASDAIITINHESRILFVNPAAEKVFGYGSAEMLGQDLTMLMPEYLRHLHHAGVERYLGTGSRHIGWNAIELPGLHKTGREIPLEISFGEWTSNGKQYFTGIARDIAERKRAEEALAASGRNLKLTIDTIPALAWSARPDGSTEFFNQHYLDFVGLSAEQASGWGWTAAVHPEDLNSLTATWQSIMASEAPGEAEARLRRHDGEYRWFLFRANPLRDEEGHIVKWYGINTDIEDRKRAEAQRDRTIEELRAQQSMLSESEQRFRAIFDEAGTGITLVDLQRPGTPIQNNRALQTMLGVTQEELGFFATYDELTAEEDREADAATFRELCSGGRDSLRQEKHFVLRDGGSVWANVIFTLLRDSAGLPRFVIAIHEDITERKRAVERLQAKQELLDLAQKSARAMAFDWYIQQDVNVWSPEQEALYGLQPGSFDGTYQSWKKLIYGPDWPVLLKAIEHAHETGEVAVEFRVQWPDGSLHWLATNGRMFFDEQGQPFRMVGFTSDVTPRKLAEEDLRRLRTELAHVSRVATLGALTASIAHEVNQPLSGIITNASTCLRMLDAEPPNVDGARETARRTIRDGHRASDVIKRLRALFSKRDAASELVDLNEATREVIALSLSELQRGRVILRTELSDGLPAVIGDRVQLQQVILNLLLNASDAMGGVEDRPRELVIRTGQDEGDCVRLSVQDAGVGFDPQAAGRLFEAFYTTKSGGMGIGLSVSRSIIESHHGRLWATPNDGPGATFSFSIPRSPGGVTDTASPGALQASALKDVEDALRKA